MKTEEKYKYYLANLKGHSLGLFLFLFVFIHLFIVTEDVLWDLLGWRLTIVGLWSGSICLVLRRLYDLKQEKTIDWKKFWVVLLILDFIISGKKWQNEFIWCMWGGFTMLLISWLESLQPKLGWKYDVNRNSVLKCIDYIKNKQDLQKI